MLRFLTQFNANVNVVMQSSVWLSVVLAGTWHVSRKALRVSSTSPSLLDLTVVGIKVVWTKSNPTPWNSVKPDENIKMMDPSGKFSKRFVVSLRPEPVDVDSPRCHSWTRDKL